MDPTVVTVDWSSIPTMSLVDDVARQIYPTAEIAKRYGLTALQLVEVCRQPEIKKMIKTRRAIWDSDANALERLRAHAQVGLIEILPGFFADMSSPSTPAAIKMDLFKTVAGIAGANAKSGGDNAAAATTFAVNIHLDGRTESVTASVTPVVDHVE